MTSSQPNQTRPFTSETIFGVEALLGVVNFSLSKVSTKLRNSTSLTNRTLYPLYTPRDTLMKLADRTTTRISRLMKTGCTEESYLKSMISKNGIHWKILNQRRFHSIIRNNGTRNSFQRLCGGIRVRKSWESTSCSGSKKISHQTLLSQNWIT